MEEHLLSIMDYAAREKVSISTIRRMIKSSKVKYKKINGKYYIHSDSCLPPGLQEQENNDEKYEQILSEYARLKKEFKRMEEDNIELKMLVKIYEKKITM
ncbi:MAG: hypothetical protein HQK50_15595 [Oligoflexia bacterium]|nr:hypothetical protein [Oligoflexia bacterium]MBF0366997.1 hypothetical protein [Oligoflexia bacterium]